WSTSPSGTSRHRVRRSARRTAARMMRLPFPWKRSMILPLGRSSRIPFHPRLLWPAETLYWSRLRLLGRVIESAEMGIGYGNRLVERCLRHPAECLLQSHRDKFLFHADRFAQVMDKSTVPADHPRHRCIIVVDRMILADADIHHSRQFVKPRYRRPDSVG